MLIELRDDEFFRFGLCIFCIAWGCEGKGYVLMNALVTIVYERGVLAPHSLITESISKHTC
jgi:hypothetical protein